MKDLIRGVRHWAMLVVICVAFSSGSVADTMFSTVTSPPTLCAPPTFTQGCTFRNGNWFGSGALLGQQFTYSQDFTVTSVAAGIFSEAQFGAGNAVTFAIVNDSSGQPGATILGTLTGTAGVGWDVPNLTGLTLASAINLHGGQNYWLVATGSTCADPNDLFCIPHSDWLWTWRDAGTGLIAQNYGAGWEFGSEQYRYAVEIGGTVTPVPVPEPGTLVLLGIGLLGSADFIRRRCH